MPLDYSRTPGGDGNQWAAERLPNGKYRVPTEPALDDRLSFAARGFFFWLITEKPDLMDSSMQDIWQASLEYAKGGRGCGKDSVFGYLRELRDCGYLPKPKGLTATRGQWGREGFIYLVKGNGDEYKIGSSRNPQGRLKDLRVYLRCDTPEIVYAIPTKNMGRVEDALHSTYEDSRVYGEVFMLTESQVSGFLALAQNLEVA